MQSPQGIVTHLVEEVTENNSSSISDKVSEKQFGGLGSFRLSTDESRRTYVSNNPHLWSVHLP